MRFFGVLYDCYTKSIMKTMPNFDNDFPNEKEKRREQFKKKKDHFHQSKDDDDLKRKNISKKELKKIKESYEEEEWEDWDRYYNH